MRSTRGEELSPIERARVMRGSFARTIALVFLALLVLFVQQRPAKAVPSFAAQTGQPCTACHIGAFGPQLTPVGRAFKIGGYTQGGGQGPATNIPLAATVIGSFTH